MDHAGLGIYSGLFSAKGRRFAREIGRERPRGRTVSGATRPADQGLVAGIMRIWASHGTGEICAGVRRSPATGGGIVEVSC
jgi:hypothetical protein